MAGKIILGGQQFDAGPLDIRSFASDPRRIFRTPYVTRRRSWIRGIVYHTTGVQGSAQIHLIQGSRPSQRDYALAHYNATNSGDDHVSWDFTVDTDGSIIQSNDPVLYYTWHANQVNGYTLGIEMITDRDGAIYSDQIWAAGELGQRLSRLLGIQEQFPAVGGQPYSGLIVRLGSTDGSGASVVGSYGHRNVTNQRGFRDPANQIFFELQRRGYEGFDFNRSEDLQAWYPRQAKIGVRTTGIPGPDTVAALKDDGYSYGIWAEGKHHTAGWIGGSALATVAAAVGWKYRDEIRRWLRKHSPVMTR